MKFKSKIFRFKKGGYLYNTRNKAFAAFIVYNWGKESFDHVELIDGQIYMYFTVDRREPDLMEFFASFASITQIIKELKPYDEITSWKAGA